MTVVDPAEVDLDGLATALRGGTDAEVRFSSGDRHLYATDASHYRQVPLGVVLPRTIDDIVATVALCREHGAPITHRGGGTSLAGQATNRAVIIDSSKHLRRITRLDPASRTADVEPGCVLDDLRDAAEGHGLTFAPDPSTHNRCTLGGMIGNNACGVHSIMGGRTSDNVRELDVLLHDGTRLRVGRSDRAVRQDAGDPRRGERIVTDLEALRDRYADEIRTRFPDIPRRVSGFNLDDLLPERGFHVARSLVGTEGTCVTVLGATVDLVDSPPVRRLLVLGYPTIHDAADDVMRVLETGCIGLEGIDAHLADRLTVGGRHDRHLALLPDGRGWLMAEYGGSSVEEAEAAARSAADGLRSHGAWPSHRLITDPADAERIWTVRKSGLAATTFIPGEPPKWTGWEDAAVAPEQLGAYLREFRALLDTHDLQASLYGHFGDGCVHCRISFDHTTRGGVARYRRFVREAADLVLDHGGSFSGEHGDGQARAELLGLMFGDDLVHAFAAFKAVWDPDGAMNPGKVVDPYPLDAHLRMRGGTSDEESETWFSYPEGDGSFVASQLRCVGVGLCRRDDGAGTMCPSYMVTHEEAHSTRGRARLLGEMLRPDSELDGWADTDVRDALHLCLSCKGCKTDCPVNIDMATYKAEFLAHHHERRRRPLDHYALGLAHVWTRLGARVPAVANAVLGLEILAPLRRLVGVTPERRPPTFAEGSFRTWWAGRADLPGPTTGEPVALFVDTFTDAYEPHIGRAAVDLLEDAGGTVVVPDDVCCGRPLYDVGMLERARGQLEELVARLDRHAAAGHPIVVLEPSCLSVMRDELPGMLPDSPAAARIAGAARSLAEHLVATGWSPPSIEGDAIVHGHCHQKADVGLDAEARLLDATGLRWRELDAGCCGLAGGFGYGDGERYEVSVAAGERVLGPEVRAADDAAFIISDGFSCRSQIAHLQDGRRGVHLAEVLHHALAGAGAPSSGPVETRLDRVAPARVGRGWSVAAAVGVAAVGAAAASLGLRAWRRRR